MALIRKGECKRCGRCCRWLHLFTALESDVDWDFVAARELRSIGNSVVSIYAKNVCHYLIDNECLIHGKDIHPESCVKFPRSPSDLLPGCGYYFEEDDEVLLEGKVSEYSS